MRKWVKRSLLGVALAMALVALFLTGGFVLLRGTPAYYRASRLSAEQRAEAATRAESKLSQMQNMAVDVRGAELRNLNGATRPAAIPGATTFSFTDDELNALFNKWAELNNWKEVMSRVVADPMVVLQDGRIILAGKVTVKNFDTVVSIHFAPTITSDGRLDLQLVSILGGKLPLPRDSVISPVRERLLRIMGDDIPYWQGRAGFGKTGTLNDDAVKATLGRLLVHTLNNEPSDPVLFLWTGNATVPVRLADVSIANNTLSLTVVPLDQTEKLALLEQIKRPMTVEQASTSN